MVNGIKKIIQFFGYNLIKPFIYLKYDKNPLSLYEQEEVQKSYDYFKKYFGKSVLSSNDQDIRDFAIKEAIKKSNNTDFFMEFGVYKARTINSFARLLTKYNYVIYGFDSFEGLSHNWYGSTRNHSIFSGAFKLDSLPKVEQNVTLIKGKVEDTLNPFLEEKTPRISFVHIDLDIYHPTKHVLTNIKKYCKSGTIILFDELYGYAGWQEHEFKALNEVFHTDEYEFIAFGKLQVAIKLN